MPTKPTHMRLDEDTLRKLDELRRRDQDIPNKTEMVRRTVAFMYKRIVENGGKQS